jgi:RHS repeat-associated protein
MNTAAAYTLDRATALLPATGLSVIACDGYAANDDSYDPNSNRLTEVTTVNNATTVNKTYAYNNRNQLTAVTDNLAAINNVSYTFDANGNQTRKTQGSAITTFSYDVKDQLLSVNQNAANVGVFAYDYQGRRIIKDLGGAIVRYAYDGTSVLVETDNTGTTLAKFDYGPDRLLSLNHATEGRAYYLFDALGSVTNLMNTSGAIQARYQYDAFGNYRSQAGSSFNRFAFTGHEKDNETNLYYFKARFYDPETGRFLNQDAYLGDVNTPPSLHRYLYAYSNPTVYVDLTGYASYESWKTEEDIPAGTRYFEFEGHYVRSDVDFATLGGQKWADYVYESMDKAGVKTKEDKGWWAKTKESIGSAVDEAGETLGNLFTQKRTQNNKDQRVVQEGDDGTTVAMSEEEQIRHDIERDFGKGARAAKQIAEGASKGADIVSEVVTPDAESIAATAAAGPIGVIASKVRKVRKGVEAVEDAASAVKATRKVEKTAGKVADESADLGTGAYKDVRGHHVHAKAAFRDHLDYDPKRGFSISQEFMNANNLSHQKMTNKQRELFKELAESGRENTLREHTHIAVEALKAGGASEETARALVARSLADLRAQGVRAPANIPWKK